MTHTSPTRRRFLRLLAATAAGAPLASALEAAETTFDAGLSRARLADLSSPSLRALAREYMLAPGVTYLNHASIGTVPRAVHEAHVRLLELCESRPSLYVWGDLWSEAKRRTRAAAADLLGCAPEDLAVTHNTTEGFNILAHGLPLGEGDEVLYSTLNHAGASAAWENLARDRGFTVRRFDFPMGRGPRLTAEEVVSLHEQALSPATRVLVFPHVDNMIGLRHPMAALVRMARERGVDFVVADGAQSAGMIPVDLGASGVDAYAMSPHKWLQSPKGLGLFYVRSQLRERLRPMWYRYGPRRYGGTAAMYEDYSTRAWPAVVALGDALAFQDSIGREEKTLRYRAIRDHLRGLVEAEPTLVWRSPAEWSLGGVLMAVEVRGRRAPALGRWLDQEHGIAVRAFGGELNTLRVSPNVTTTDEDLDRLVSILASA